MMPNDDGSDLGKLEQKIPHLQFLMELFTDNDRAHRWDDQRKARFARVESILLRCFDDMQAYARQMVNNAGFTTLMNHLKRAVDALETAHRHIRNAPVRMQQYLDLMNWEPSGSRY